MAWNAEVFADLPGEIVVDFSVARNCRVRPLGPTKIEWLPPSRSKRQPWLLQVADQRAPLHAVTLSDSRMTGPLPVTCCANSRFASKIIETAS